MKDFWFKYKLPSLYRFRGSTKNGKTPYHLFYDWVKEVIGPIPDNHLLDVGSVGLHPNDENKLREYTIAWAMRKYRPYMTRKKAESEVAFLNLDIGPRLLDSLSKGVNKGYVYINMNTVFKRR